ncbi:hypothetical protein [Nocardioides massiliensis]|uniref:Uncharacterized protein n=1 Tax=Nocardioides massiliensis TaxID=1325935 RepID=A0ABT9NJ03_9ACTN|nr:hypothetical protein [Nocardioides massiliensis]MDP9820399.1 hypothetical protein [Nocardioides massiliensis]
MTDILSRIDATVADWEAQPEAWVPGDPLFEDPRSLDDDRDAQIVRPMIQLLDDHSWRESIMRCRDCEVSWAGIAPCWVCGEHRPPVGPPSYAGSDDAHRLLATMRAEARRATEQRIAELAVTVVPVVFHPHTNCISPLRPAEPHEGDTHP